MWELLEMKIEVLGKEVGRVETFFIVRVWPVNDKGNFPLLMSLAFID